MKTVMETATRFWLVRHAPIKQPAPRIYGHMDLDCDCSDEARMARLAGVLPQDAALVITPLKRTARTARTIAAAGWSAPEPQVRPALMEQNLGRWEGHDWESLHAADPERLATFWSDPARSRPPDGESFADMLARVGRELDALAEEFTGRDVVCVMHAGSIRAAVCHALDMTPDAGLRMKVAPLSLTRLHRESGAWVLYGMNG